MALVFTGASSQYLSKATAIVSATPCSFALWFKPGSIAANQVVMGVGNSSALNYRDLIFLTTGAANAVTATSGGSVSATSAASMTVGTWYHMASVYTSSTSVTVYLNGVATTAASGAQAPSGLNQTTIAALQHVGITGFTTGTIAYPASWSIGLSQSDVTSLSLGASPKLVRPDKLAAYARLIGSSPEPDWIFTGGWTLNGSPTVSANPLVYNP